MKPSAGTPWRGTRGTKPIPSKAHQLFGFLTIDANDVVGVAQAKFD
jgi:hypothetical protein